MQKSALEKLYRSHHIKGSRYGYLYCHGARIPFLKDWIGEGKKVLDLGCRDGVLTKSFIKGNDVTGVDIDRAALEILAKNIGIKTEWLDLNAEWPFANDSFDVVVACEILEHLYSLDTTLAHIAASLKGGGLFIGSVPNSFRLRNRLQFLRGKEFDKDPTHVRRFSYNRVLAMLEVHFTDVQIVPIEGKIIPCFRLWPEAPKSFVKLFAKDLMWVAKRKEKVDV